MEITFRLPQKRLWKRPSTRIEDRSRALRTERLANLRKRSIDRIFIRDIYLITDCMAAFCVDFGG